MKLYHVGFESLPKPDVHHGRPNADFGAGFYLSDDLDFSRRWAKIRVDKDTVLNEYSLDDRGLKVKWLTRDQEWFDGIVQSRRFGPDPFLGYDVVIGPIANDTIYDTWGILTSGLVSPDRALAALQLGPEYRQIVLKTEKAVAQLCWMGSVILDKDEVRSYREQVKKEEEAYQKAVASLLRDVLDEIQ